MLNNFNQKDYEQIEQKYKYKSNQEDKNQTQSNFSVRNNSADKKG